VVVAMVVEGVVHGCASVAQCVVVLLVRTSLVLLRFRCAKIVAGVRLVNMVL